MYYSLIEKDCGDLVPTFSINLSRTSLSKKLSFILNTPFKLDLLRPCHIKSINSSTDILLTATISDSIINKLNIFLNDKRKDKLEEF